MELVVLGSGGPFVNTHRASSGYLVRLDDGTTLLVDAGGGAFERLGSAGVAAAGLGPVLLTHFHIDHSGGLAPIVFSAYMEGRTEPLTLVGPAARDDQPGCRQFADRLFGDDGAWSYLHSFDGFGIEAREAPSDPGSAEEVTVIDSDTLRVRTVAVPHGMMPALAYRIDHGGHSVVFSGDVESEHRALVDLASGCDVLVHDLALPERDVPHGQLHAKPSEVGRVARDAGCRKLVLTHVMPELEDELDAALAQVRKSYTGVMVVAEDLMRIAVSPPAPGAAATSGA